MASRRLAFFDAHNHVHMSMPGQIPPFEENLSMETAEAFNRHSKDVANTLLGEVDCSVGSNVVVRGMALMSTQPRDFAVVNIVCDKIRRAEEDCLSGPFKSVPCYGVHPWFLHEAEADGAVLGSDPANGGFWWEELLRQSLLENPSACVGEIGLDTARYDPATGNPYTPLDRQVEAFEAQLRIATELERPVSVHAVRAWGPLLNILNKRFGKKKGDKPPRMYFHAFGGKPAVVDQVDAACRGTSEVIYGFAPIINFRSPKTAEVIRKIGIDRLVLETDHEDYRCVKDSLDANANFVAKALDMDKVDVINRTSANALRFYGLE